MAEGRLGMYAHQNNVNPIYATLNKPQTLINISSAANEPLSEALSILRASTLRICKCRHLLNKSVSGVSLTCEFSRASPQQIGQPQVRKWPTVLAGVQGIVPSHGKRNHPKVRPKREGKSRIPISTRLHMISNIYSRHSPRWV